jgi:predicted unusual protein kinase regulating ubiquinone biosynthesis (AarF/ABC1/UbiB family)
MTDPRKLPEGRVGRLARLAALGVRTGASLLRARDPADHAPAAERAAEVLGTLRGLAAKVGQMASYVDGLVPEPQRAAYEGALKALRDRAPTSSPEAIRRVIREDLGAEPDALFAAWEERPFASASIGQVHRARLADGRAVAVKVQHPGVRKAVESDLDNASIVELLVRTTVGRKVESKRLLEEIRERFLEELDYGLEADRQRAFHALHAGDPTIRVPAVIDDRSSARVLTTELAEGTTLDEAAEGGEAERRAHAETLWRFVFRGNLVGGMFNADPHPGNYLFQPEGRVVFLDFGCVQPIEGERLRRAIALHRAAGERDEAGFARAAAAILGTQGGRWEELSIAYSRTCFEPLFRSPFRIDRAFTASLAERLKAMKSEALADETFVTPPPGMVFMNRLQFGFYSVLTRLDVEVDYAGVERPFVEEAEARIRAGGESAPGPGRGTRGSPAGR